MTSLLHVSDTHLRYEQYGSRDRGRDFAGQFEAALARGISRNVDAVVHTGDVLHRDTPADDAVYDEVLDALVTVAANDLEFYYVVGNHDKDTDDGTESRLFDAFAQLEFVHRLTTSPTRIGDCSVYGHAHRYDPWWEREGEGVTLDAPHPDTERNVLCLHQSVTPFRPETQTELSLAAFLERQSVDVDCVLLGHLHKANARVVERTPAYYGGSPSRMHRAYDDDDRSAYVVEITGDGISRREVELPSRPFETHTLVGRRTNLPEYAREAAASVEDGAVVTVHVCPTADAAGTVERTAIKRAFRAAGAVDVSCEDRGIVLSNVPAGHYAGRPREVVERTDGTFAETFDPETPLLVHIGRAHVGRYNLTGDREAEFYATFEDVANRTVRESGDAVVQTGNLFGTKRPSSSAVEDAAAVLRMLGTNGVPVYHVPSEREAEMDAVEGFYDRGLLTRLTTDPAVVAPGGSEVALYGIGPDPGTAIPMLESLRPTDAGTGVVAMHHQVSPPLDPETDRYVKPGRTIEYDDIVEALPAGAPVDLLVCGGHRHPRYFEGSDDGPAVCYAGEVERELGLRLFNDPPPSGSVATLDHGDGWSVDWWDLDTPPVCLCTLDDCTADEGIDAVARAVEAEIEVVTDAILQVRLYGTRSGEKVTGNDLARALDGDPHFVEVWDKRTR